MQQIFRGKIICNDNIDLSNVEIKIYESKPYYDKNRELSYLGESYSSSVYTNQNGYFEFIKPSNYCSFSINLKTLPDGYGALSHTKFIHPNITSSNIEIFKIE